MKGMKFLHRLLGIFLWLSTLEWIKSRGRFSARLWKPYWKKAAILLCSIEVIVLVLTFA
jgi:hypothetical protein